MPRKKRINVRVTITLPEPELRQVDDLAVRKTIPRSAIIRLAVLDYLEKQRRAEQLHRELDKATADLEALEARYVSKGSPPAKYPPEKSTHEDLKQIEALERKRNALFQKSLEA